MKNKITKFSSSQSYYNDEIFQNLADSSAQTLERISELKKFNSKIKSNTKSNCIKTDWMKENKNLEESGIFIQNEISSLIEVLVFHTPDDYFVHELVREMTDISAESQTHKQNIKFQLHEVKAMMRDILKDLPENVTNNENSSKVPSKSSKRIYNVENLKFSTKQSKSREKIEKEQTEEQNDARGSAYSPAISIFADLLVQVIGGHNTLWSSMKDEEAKLFDDIVADRRMITSMLRGERLEEQNERFKREFDMKLDGVDAESDGQGCESATAMLVMEEWFQRLSALDRAHSTECQLIDAERESALMSLGLVHVSGDPCGGWDRGEHDLFVKIVKEVNKNGSSRKVQSDLFSAQLPHRSRDQVSLHEEWYRACRSFAQKRKDAITLHNSRREELIVQAKEQWRQFLQERQQAREGEAEALRRETLRSTLSRQLAALREEAQVRRSEQRDAEALQQLQEEQRQREEQARDAEERERRKVKVEEYRETKRKESEEERRRLQEEQQQREAEVKREVEENRERVAMRELQRLERQDERRTKESAELEEETRRMERLLAIARQVPYFEAIQEAQPKLEHMTAAALAQKYEKPEPLGRGQLPLLGLTDQRVIGDARFRLAAALRQAGVQGTDAARQIVASFHPRPHLAIHGIL